MTARFEIDLAGPSLAASVDEKSLFIQPIGAVEHHGPHLPLGTDSIVVDELAKGVMDKRRDLDLVMLPTLSYGLSTEHIWAPGTITMSASTVLAVLGDVAASVVRAGGTRLAFFNGHGGPRDFPPHGRLAAGPRGPAHRPTRGGTRHPRRDRRDLGDAVPQA
jgi:creatinine amidohydrolase